MWPFANPDDVVAGERRARRFIAQRARDAAPYFFHLRNFAVSKMHGGERDGDVRPYWMHQGLSYLARQWRLEFVSVANVVRSHSGKIMHDQGIARSRPRNYFNLGDDWREIVRELARHAAVIVSEFSYPTGGSAEEIDMLVEVGAESRTALVLPEPYLPHRECDSYPAVRNFKRCIYWNELVTTELQACFQLNDLMVRAISFKHLDRVERQLINEIPILSGHLPPAYLRQADHDIQLAAVQSRDFPDQGFVQLAHRAYWRLHRFKLAFDAALDTEPMPSRDYLIAIYYVTLARACFLARVTGAFPDAPAQIGAGQRYHEQARARAQEFAGESPEWERMAQTFLQRARAGWARGV